jgi:hypothetical protein
VLTMLHERRRPSWSQPDPRRQMPTLLGWRTSPLDDTPSCSRPRSRSTGPRPYRRPLPDARLNPVRQHSTNRIVLFVLIVATADLRPPVSPRRDTTDTTHSVFPNASFAFFQPSDNCPTVRDRHRRPFLPTQHRRD